MPSKALTTYKSLATLFYDLEDHVNHRQALSFYMMHAQQARGPILEPMCGSGRFLIPMLEAGLDVEGFDASPAMLTALQKKYAQTNQHKAPVWQQFIQDFKSNKRYKLIFIPYGSWGLIINHTEVIQALLTLFHHLDRGGKLLVEIETTASAPKQCGIKQRAIRRTPDGTTIALNFITSYFPTTQLFQSRAHYELIMNNRIVMREDEFFEQYLYHADEFEQLLANAGFKDIRKYPAFESQKTVSTTTPIIIYEAIKK